MKREQERELEKTESWDFEQSEIREPVNASRVVVSVAFRHDDFVKVSEYAERLGKKISVFIREAAIEKVTGGGAGVLVYGGGSAGTLWGIEYMPSITRVLGLSIEPEEAVVTTR